MKNVLIIFIRNPETGKVKTRLARVTGPEEALRIYRILLDKTRETSINADVERWLYYSDFIPEDDEWPNDLFHKKLQSGLDLGERMESAFREAFDAGAERVAIIGSDCPELDADTIHRAFDLLAGADFVLGPVADGGYYLLGMKHPHFAVFHDIPWSTDRVLSLTLEIIESGGKSWTLLPVLHDIDEAEDWHRYISERS